MKIKDLTNQKFGMLTALKIIGKNNQGNMIWQCQCDCGNISNRSSGYLVYAKKYEKKQSCGCLMTQIRKINGSKVGGHNRKPYGESSFNYLFNLYKTRAYSRGYSFDLTKEQFMELTKQNCYYCGIEPKQESFSKRLISNGKYIYNGLDRIDNSKGYSLCNSVACCGRCNRAKDTMALFDFYNWILTIKENMGKNNFLIENPNWTEDFRTDDNNGLLILKNGN